MHTNRPEFLKNFIIKEGCQIGYQWKNANKVYIFENFLWRLWTGVSQRMIWTVLKTDSGHVALLTDNFFFMSNPERFSSSLKKTIIPDLVKKFGMFMAIFTSGRRSVFFKKRFFISASRRMHLTLNLQAWHYRNINYYNIYISSFTRYYLSIKLISWVRNFCHCPHYQRITSRVSDRIRCRQVSS